MTIVVDALSLLLEFMRDKNAEMWKGFLFATFLFLLSCLQSLFHHHYMFHCFTVGMRLKTAVMGLVYRKVTDRQVAVRQETTGDRKKETYRQEPVGNRQETDQSDGPLCCSPVSHHFLCIEACGFFILTPGGFVCVSHLCSVVFGVHIFLLL